MSLERDVRGIKFTINVDSQGQFWTRFQDRNVTGESLDKLITKLNSMTREAFSGLEVSFHRFYWDSQTERNRRFRSYGDPEERAPRVRAGKVIGYNVHQNGLIVDWADITKKKGERGEVISSYFSHSEYVDLILEGADELDRLKALVSAYDRAKKQLDAYLEERKVELRKLWDEQVAEMPK